MSIQRLHKMGVIVRLKTDANWTDSSSETIDFGYPAGCQ